MKKKQAEASALKQFKNHCKASKWLHEPIKGPARYDAIVAVEGTPAERRAMYTYASKKAGKRPWKRCGDNDVHYAFKSKAQAIKLIDHLRMSKTLPKFARMTLEIHDLVGMEKKRKERLAECKALNAEPKRMAKTRKKASGKKR